MGQQSENSSKESNPGPATALALELDGKLLACCEATLATHARNNSMMVCGTCKQIIKCFKEEKDFRNYSRFCQSRHRQVVSAYRDPHYVLIYRAFHATNSGF